MYPLWSIERVFGGTIVGAIVIVAYLVLEIIDRLTESPAMRAHVNAGSEQFFAERGSIWHAATQSAADFLRQFTSHGV